MSKKIKIVSIVIVCLAILLIATFNTKRILNLETGEQKYIRSILGIQLMSQSETGFFECGSWQNPLPNQTGEVVLSNCSVFNCKKNNEVEFKC